MVVDPGLGLAKRAPQSYEILDRLHELARLGRPVLVSPSRKPFLTDSIKAPPMDWVVSAAAAIAVAVCGGAHIVRAYEVAEARAAARVGDRILEISEAD